MFYKIVIVFNWLVIAVLGFLVLAELFSPHKGGGDAAGRGMGQALVMLAWVVLFVLILLNVLPYRAPRYAAFALVAVPFVLINWGRPVRRFVGGLWSELTAKPPFPDRERNQITYAIWKGNPEKLQKALDAAPADSLRRFDYSWELLDAGIRAADWADHTEQRRECLRILLRAGLPLLDPDGEGPALHFGVLYKPELLKIMLENGADPNARCHDVSSGTPRAVPFMFEALTTHYAAYEAIRLLLVHGADPNAMRPPEYDEPEKSIFFAAAQHKRYDVCRLLLEHGANPHGLPHEHDILRQWLKKADPRFPDQGITAADIESVKAAVLEPRTAGN